MCRHFFKDNGDVDEIFLQRRYKKDQRAYGKMLSIIIHHGNAMRYYFTHEDAYH